MNYKPYKHLPPFKGMVLQNFPFIEEDFDAITNYQLLCKIVEYLKNVIANELTMEENVTNLYNSFVELKNYVDNYFANLDVQEEINNKLDEMTEDGTLQEIVGDYLNANALWCFDTIEDMKSSTNLIDGSFARTLGYYTINDGGSALYKIRRIINEDIVDNMFIIPMEDENLIAELITENDTVNIKQIGAKGDGITDDSLFIQNAINTNKHVFFPEGTYKLDNSINVTNKSNWNFDSKLARIEYTGNDYAFIFNHIINSNLDFGVIISNNGGCISFIGNSSSNNSQYVNISFLYFSASTNCINAICTGDSWINEFRISKGRLGGGVNGVYILHNSSLGLSNWTFSELGIEGVTQGFLFEVGSYAEENDRYITSLNFINCRTHESPHTIKTIGKVLKGLIIQSRYMRTDQLDLSEDTNDWKMINADRTLYVHNGGIYENSIDGSSDVTLDDDFVTDAMRLSYNDSFAKLQFNLNAKNSDITLAHNDLICSGLPKPKYNIYFIATTFGTSYEIQPRFILNTSGELRAYYPGNAVIHTGNYPTMINITYPLKVFGIQSR